MFSDLEYGMMVNIIPATSLLPKLEAVTVLGKCGYDLAETISDIAATQANVFSTIEKEIDSDFRLYEYLIYRDASGERHAIPDAWIENVVIVQKLKVRLDVTLDNRETLEKLQGFLESRAIEYTLTNI